MFKPVLGWVARLAPFASAMLVSVAVGASTHTAEMRASGVSSDPAHHRAAPVALRPVVLDDTSVLGPHPIDGPLIARAATLDVVTATYPVESLDTALTAPVVPAASGGDLRGESKWPKPDRGTALMATLALVAFFFLRRIV